MKKRTNSSVNSAPASTVLSTPAPASPAGLRLEFTAAEFAQLGSLRLSGKELQAAWIRGQMLAALSLAQQSMADEQTEPTTD